MNLKAIAKARGFRPLWATAGNKGEFRPANIQYKLNGKVKILRSTQQEKYYKDMVKSLNIPKLLIISSMPTDYQANKLAEGLFMAVLEAQMNKGSPARELPYWHSMMSSYQDEVRDAYREYKDVKLLVLNNVYNDSTGIKLEKTRDLIYRYSRVPKIITVSGCNAIEFAMKLNISPHGVIHLSANKNIRL